MSSSKPVFPLVPADDPGLGACSAAEPFALVVLGDSMLPEFAEGEVIVIEPEGLARDGSYVLAHRHDEYIFRQLLRRESGWVLHPLNPTYADEAIGDLSVVKGVVIQKQAPGGRRSTRKRYVE